MQALWQQSGARGSDSLRPRIRKRAFPRYTGVQARRAVSWRRGPWSWNRLRARAGRVGDPMVARGLFEIEGRNWAAERPGSDGESLRGAVAGRAIRRQRRRLRRSSGSRCRGPAQRVRDALSGRDYDVHGASARIRPRVARQAREESVRAFGSPSRAAYPLARGAAAAVGRIRSGAGKARDRSG